MTQALKIRPKKRLRTELSIDERRKRLGSKEIYALYMEEYPDSKLVVRQFSKIVHIYFSSILERIFMGEAYKVYRGFVFQILRVKNKLVNTNRIDWKASVEYKKKLFGCNECDSLKDTTKGFGNCRQTTKRNLLALDVCPKNPEGVVFKSKKHPEGVKWAMRFYDNYYLTMVMRKKKAKAVKHKMIYDFSPEQNVLTRIRRLKDQSIYEIQ